MRVGTVISLAEPALAELLGSALDFAWIDLEHGALGPRDVQQLAIALAATGCSAHVRLPSPRSDVLGPVLDAGVEGIVAPRIETAAEACALVERLRYPPAGGRGYGPRRAGGYGRTGRFWETDGARVACTVQIESPAGVEAAREIATTPGVDAVVVGCADLSLALDAPQDLRSPPVRAALAEVEAACAHAGVAFGLAASGPPEALDGLLRGVALVVYSADVRLYSGAVDGAVSRLEELHATA